MSRTFLNAAAVAIAASITCLSHAGTGSQNAGFPVNFECEPGQLLYRQVGLGRVTNIAYHNGVFVSNNVAGNGQRWWRFTDPDDPSSLVIYDPDANSPRDQGNHAHTKVGEWLCGGWGCRARAGEPGELVATLRPPSAPGEISAGFTPQNQPAPDDSGLHRLYYPWAVPFNWIQYGAQTSSGRIYRGDQLLADWEPLADHGVAGNGILLGNYLFIVSDASMLGVVSYDISPVFDDPPGQPIFLDKLSGQVGAYIGAVWEHYLVLSGGDDRDIFFVVDYADPSNLQLVATMDLSGDPSLNAGTSVPYVQTQDEYVFTRRHKINMETLQPVLELDEAGNNRPAGSVSGALDVSQYTLPVGNLLVSGGHGSSREGVGVWCHQSEPDTRAPYVGYHLPRPGQTGYPLGAPVSLVIAETLRSETIINGETIMLRPLGGDPVDAWVSFAHDGILTVTPYEYLEPDTSYELLVVGDGIKDAAGNGIEAYAFTFSTGSDVGGNQPPEITSFSAHPSPAEPGDVVTLSVTANDPDSDPMEYRFFFGDGTAATGWMTDTQVQHQYTASGHFDIKVQVRDLHTGGTGSSVAAAQKLTVAAEIPGPRPVNSSTVAIDEERRLLWVVNPDNDSISRMNADNGQLIEEIMLADLLGLEERITPWALTVVPGSGEVWVALQEADSVAVLSPTGSLLAGIDLGYGSAPRATLASVDGQQVYVSTWARGAGNRRNGRVLRYAAGSRELTGELELGPSAGAMALTGNGQRLFVARFLSDEHFGEIWEVDPQDMSLRHSIALWRDRGASGLDTGGSNGPGLPNYVSSIVLHPHEDWLWYTAVKHDTNRGEFFDQGTGLNTPLTHDSTVRPMLGRIDLMASTPHEPNVGSSANQRIDTNNSDFPSALAFSPRGGYIFTALQGNDMLFIFDDFAIRDGGGRASLARIGVGSAPRGLAWDFETDRLWVQSFMSRDLQRIDMGEFLATGNRTFPRSEHDSIVAEALPAPVLRGKQVFYFAGNHPEGRNEMSFEGYISCASCHVDGSHDGRVWDFTQRGEGLRNTHDLRGRAGMGHGNVHWTANFDEIQDFVIDIVEEFGGLGFLPPGELPNPPLGAPNAGRALELDDMAAYLSFLGRETLPRSPWRESDGRMSELAEEGEQVFASIGCASCHDPASDFTDTMDGGVVLHNVGTLRDSSGGRLGEPLQGITTQTLYGIWDTPPYFHDGSALELADVFAVAGGTIYQAEHGTMAGGAFVPDYIDINWDSSAIGELVIMGSNGASVTIEEIDGGSGGLGSVELRWSPRSGGVVSIMVNNDHYQEVSVVRERTRLEWHRIRFENVPLNAGANNTIRVRRESSTGGSNPALDQITVSTSDDLALAAPHRVAGELSGSEMAQLLAFLRELDGRDAGGFLFRPDRLFRDRFMGGSNVNP